MKRNQTEICTNCQIEEEEQKKNQQYLKIQTESSLGKSDSHSMQSRKTNPDLNIANIRFKLASKNVDNQNLLEQIKEEKANMDPNVRFAKSSFGNLGMRTQSAKLNQFAQSEMPQNKFSFEPKTFKINEKSGFRNPNENRNSILSTNSFLENLVQETIVNDDKSLNLMSEINQAYLEQIKQTIFEIKNSQQLSNIEKFQMMKEVMQEYKMLVNSNNQ